MDWSPPVFLLLADLQDCDAEKPRLLFEVLCSVI